MFRPVFLNFRAIRKTAYAMFLVTEPTHTCLKVVPQSAWAIQLKDAFATQLVAFFSRSPASM